jgi:hypothetical protein
LQLFCPAIYGTADVNVGHVRRYYKKPLESLIESVGFKIVKSNYFDIVGNENLIKHKTKPVRFGFKSFGSY